MQPPAVSHTFQYSTVEEDVVGVPGGSLPLINDPSSRPPSYRRSNVFEENRGNEPHGALVLDLEDSWVAIDSDLGMQSVTRETNHVFNEHTPVVLFMGLTGAGKSTFISQLTPSPITIGNDLESCTQEIEMYDAVVAGRTVRLIDTPGFDDTQRSDTDSLGAIATALALLYRTGIPLVGVIYLHRISDTRVGGSSKKSIRLLEAMCGPEAYPGIAVVTTMWDKLSNRSDGDRREAQLVADPEFFGPLFSSSPPAITMRYTGVRSSAEAIVQELLLRSQERPIVLQIQRQLVDENLALEDTEAGMFVDSGLSQLQKQLQSELEELEQVLAEAQDEVTSAQLKEEQQSQAQLLQDVTAARAGMRGTWEILVEQALLSEVAERSPDEPNNRKLDHFGEQLPAFAPPSLPAVEGTGEEDGTLADMFATSQNEIQALRLQLRDFKKEQRFEEREANKERIQRLKRLEDQLKIQTLQWNLDESKATIRMLEQSNRNRRQGFNVGRFCMDLFKSVVPLAGPLIESSIRPLIESVMRR